MNAVEWWKNVGANGEELNPQRITSLMLNPTYTRHHIWIGLHAWARDGAADVWNLVGEVRFFLQKRLVVSIPFEHSNRSISRSDETRGFRPEGGALPSLVFGDPNFVGPQTECKIAGQELFGISADLVELHQLYAFASPGVGYIKGLRVWSFLP